MAQETGRPARRIRRHAWRKLRKGAAWLVLGSCGVAMLHTPLVATPLVSFPTYTSPTEMDGTNPQLITLTLSTSGTDSFDTLAFDTVLNWTVTGTTWSGNPITPDLLTLSNFSVLANGDLFAPLNAPTPLTATVTNNSSTSVGQANFIILSNGDINTGVPYQTSPIGTVDFTVDADVRTATFSLAFSSNPNFSFFTEPTTFDPVPFANGGGSISVVPEPASLVGAVGLSVMGGTLAASALRMRRRRQAADAARG
jgi:hypothetical protein